MHAVQSPVDGVLTFWTGRRQIATHATGVSFIALKTGPAPPWQMRSRSGSPIEVSIVGVPVLL